MKQLIIAITLEALRQKIASDKNPRRFLAEVPPETMSHAGLSTPLWQDQICETHDRYVGHIEMGKSVTTFCRDCLHKHIQHTYGREAQYLDQCLRRGIDVPDHIQRAVRVFGDGKREAST